MKWPKLAGGQPASSQIPSRTDGIAIKSSLAVSGQLEVALLLSGATLQGNERVAVVFGKPGRAQLLLGLVRRDNDQIRLRDAVTKRIVAHGIRLTRWARAVAVQSL